MNESVTVCGRDCVKGYVLRTREHFFHVCVSAYMLVRVCAPQLHTVHTHTEVYTHHSAIRQQQPALKGAEGCLEIKVITQIEPYGLNISELKFTRQ